MAELGLVANVIAVVNLSTKIASSCYQYSRDVRDAKVDIERFDFDTFKRCLKGLIDLALNFRRTKECAGGKIGRAHV